MGNWVIDIETEYQSNYPSEYELKQEKRSIYRWPNDLARTSKLSMHRTPHMASFGPYHHREEHLQAMERHKEIALYRILKRTGVSLSSLIDSLKGIEQELRDTYDNLDPKLTSDAFLKMMLFDGCFMLEIIRAKLLDITVPSAPSERKDDLVFSRDGPIVNTVIRRDILILENQIPLLVLRKLVGIQKGRDVKDDSYLKDLLEKCWGLFQNSTLYSPNLHFLDAYRKCLIASAEMAQIAPSTAAPTNSVRTQLQSRLCAAGKKLMSFLLCIPIFWETPKSTAHVRSAARFHEAGVEFVMGNPSFGLKITFDKENGVLTLPPILVDDNTAATYINIMTFERMHPRLWGEGKVTSYVAFMDSLVDTVEDVNLLCTRGIMNNMLGSDEEAAIAFNNLGSGITYCPDYEVYSPLQKYAASGWNAAKAYLKRKYFRNPWTILSVVAAAILLGLTFIQALFAILDFTLS